MPKRISKPRTVHDPNDCLLTTKRVLAIVPVDRSTRWRMCREGHFPKPIQITPSRIAWRQSAVLQWLDEREAHPIKPRIYFGREELAVEPKGEREA